MCNSSPFPLQCYNLGDNLYSQPRYGGNPRKGTDVANFPGRRVLLYLYTRKERSLSLSEAWMEEQKSEQEKSDTVGDRNERGNWPESEI